MLEEAKQREQKSGSSQNTPKETYNKGKIVVAICHGHQVLISAGLVKGKRVTSYVAVKDDLINAGAVFIDEPAVRNGNIITNSQSSR